MEHDRLFNLSVSDNCLREMAGNSFDGHQCVAVLMGVLAHYPAKLIEYGKDQKNKSGNVKNKNSDASRELNSVDLLAFLDQVLPS